MRFHLPLYCLLGLVLLGQGSTACGSESIWIEAEHLRGIQGSCFPDMGGKTNGQWAFSGPGIAPEWTQGGESGWLSIACAPDDDRAKATTSFEVPEAGGWTLWVRYRDWRKETELFAVRIEQPGQPVREFIFGEMPVADVDEEDELKILWDWCFGWDSKTLPLVKGPATLTLLAHAKQKVHRQVDCFCLTTDKKYHPYHREKPTRATWSVLESLRTVPPASRPLASRVGTYDIPAAWKPTLLAKKDFHYLWNVGKPWEDDVASIDPKRMLVPYQTEPALLPKFREIYGGRTDVPIFSDPRIVPVFHGAGPNVLDNPHVVRWLDANPERPWTNLMNYIDPKPLTPAVKGNWAKYRERYLGNISGENLGYFSYDAKQLDAHLQAAKSREDVYTALTEIYQAGNAAKQKLIFGEKVTEPYRYTIPCQSSEMIAFAHACREWGARTVGYENTAVIPGLALRRAFLRGSARQYGGAWATYRSSNFGDAATIYSEQSTYANQKKVYDNWYDLWLGAGSTWYKFDLWHQYLSGSNLFYHEQGFDEFWMPGGDSTPRKPLQLSPKGKLVEQFLQVTRRHHDRGVPYTPIAFLLDRAHGWEPNGNQPGYFGRAPALNPDVLGFDKHAAMLKEWFGVAYYPYGPREATVNTAVNQNFIPGVFGNIFDVLVTSPTKMDVLDSYPVVVLNGDLNLSAAWGQQLAQYLEKGGTLIASADQLSGPGVTALKLPNLGAAAEERAFKWQPTSKEISSQAFRYRPITGGQKLATAAHGDTLAAVFERGKGRLVYLGVPRGLGIDNTATPLVALVLAHARQGLLPVEVEGEVEWLLNRTEKGWLVTLLNPAGNQRLQHGVGPTDYAQKRTVRIFLRPEARVSEWFTGANLEVRHSDDRAVVTFLVPAGGVRIVEIQ